MSEDTLVKQFVDAATKPLLAEIDLLRADLAAEECAARDFEANQTYLLAEIETLREAGEGLARANQARENSLQALAAWRKAVGEKPLTEAEEIIQQTGGEC